MGESEDEYPELFGNYIAFCRYRQYYEETGKIDLGGVEFFYPTTLLPLLNLMIDTDIDYEDLALPSNPDVANYFQTILETDLESSAKKSYIPLVQLPTDPDQCSSVMQRIYQLPQGTGFGGEDAFKYVVDELIDNIYQHSSFTRAMVMAQKYATWGHTDLTFFDNGITIAGSYAKQGMNYIEQEHFKAIYDALRGLSTKPESGRGYGLRSSVRMFVEGLRGSVLIVSGSGAVFLHRETQYSFSLTKPYRLNGTLITLRVPYSTDIINIYEYVE